MPAPAPVPPIRRDPVPDRSEILAAALAALFPGEVVERLLDWLEDRA